MPITPKIFKAYDIRALSPQELDADGAFRIGQAVAKHTNAKTLIMGRDMRTTSPELTASFADGAMSQGCDVVEIGLVTTPMLYWAVANAERVAGKKVEAGVMITASHNPAEYNGIKLTYGDMLPIGAATGMDKVRDLAMAGPYPETAHKGSQTQFDIRAIYVDALVRKVNECSLAKVSLVIDTANGMEGSIITDILARFPNLTWHGLYLELDGNFPNHEANPLKHETLHALQHEVIDCKANVGFAFDGDGDRVGVIDEKGNVVPGDVMTALIAGELLAQNPGAKIIHDIVSSRIIPEYVREKGGVPVMSRVGHGFIKPKMREEGALFAGEFSSHFYFADMGNSESSDLVMLMVIALIARTGKPLSELVAPLRKYVHSGENNFTLAPDADKQAIYERIRTTYAPSASSISDIDGIRMEFFDPAHPAQDWWFSVRASNTEPLMRLVVEASEEGVMKERLAQLEEMLR